MKKSILISLLFSLATLANAFPTWEPFVPQPGGGTAYNGANGGSLLEGQVNVSGERWLDLNGGSGPLSVIVTNFDFNAQAFSAFSFPAGYPPIPTNSIWLPSTGVNGNTGQSACLQFNRVISQPSGSVSSYGAAATNKVFVSFMIDVPSVQNVGSAIFLAGMVGTGLTNGSFSAGGTPPGAPSADLRFYLSSNTVSGTYAMGISNVNGAPLNFGGDFQPNNFEQPSAVYFVVIDYEMGGTNNTANSLTNDHAHLWINPAVNTFGASTAPAVATAASGTTVGVLAADALTNIAGFYVLARTGGTQPTNGTYFSSLAVGSTWSYVTGGPEFSTPPTNSPFATLGGTVSLSGIATAIGQQSISYQWYRGGAALTDGPDGNGSTISGSATTNLTISGLTAADTGSYSLVAMDSISSITNTVTVSLDPSIVTQPVSHSVTAEASTTFSVSAITADPPLTYQWQRNGQNLTDGTSGTGTVYSGSQTATLSLSSVSFGDNQAVYDCVVSNAAGVFTVSAGATLTVNDPVVSSQPANQVTNYLGTASFSVTAAGTGPFTYQWQFKGVDLSNGSSISGSGATVNGATSAMLQLNNVTYLDAGSYTVVVTDPNGSTTSSAATLVVKDPYIIAQPSPTNQFVTAGATAQFSVSAAGSPPLTYQWLKNGTAISDGASGSGSTYSGSATSTLTISGTTVADDGSYSVVINSASGTNVTSSAALLTVYAPVTVTPAQSLRVSVGANVPFGPIVTGTLPGYQWQFDGVNIPGATNSTFVTNKVTVASAGTYTLVVTNRITTNSVSMILTVSPYLIPLVSTNLIVARVGDDVQVLNTNGGNTLYFDQYTTNGNYISTTVIPDTGSNAFIIAGGSVDGRVEGFVTSATNNTELVFAGFNVARPVTNALGVGDGSQVSAPGTIRGIGELNGFGYFNIALTNLGLYSAGSQIRSATSTDGVTNFWTTGGGLGSSGGVKFVDDYLALGGLGLPELTASEDARVVIIDNYGNLYYTIGVNNAGVNPAPGWYAVTSPGGNDGPPSSPPTNGPPTGGATLYLTGYGASDPNTDPNDMAVFTDVNQNTILYVADDRPTASGGGIQCFINGSYQYTLSTGTAGAWGVAVDFSQVSNETNAMIYATTATTNGNQLVRIVDPGAQYASAAVPQVLATAGPAEMFRGLRFGPNAAAVSIASEPLSQSVSVDDTVDFSIGLSGGAPYFYQWAVNGANIAGATNAFLSLSNVTLANAGTYTVAVSNLLGNAVSVPAVLTVSPFNTNANLVGWWPLNDGAGSSTAADQSGNGNNGQLQGFPDDTGCWVTDLDGLTALNFAYPNTNAPSDTDIVLVNDAPSLNFSNNLAFTLAAWVLAVTNNMTEGAIIAKGFGNGGEQYCLEVDNNTYRFFVRNQRSQVYDLHSSAAINEQWQHVVATYDGYQQFMNLYVNGQLVDSFTGTNAPSQLLYTDWPLQLGNRAGSSAGNDTLPFMGPIQDVRIYNYALGSANVQTLYTGLAAPNYVSISQQPQPASQTAAVGGSVTFTAAGSGPGPIGYQWALNGTNIAGATNSSLTINPVEIDNEGSYTVVVSNDFNSVLSQPAVLTVLEPTPSQFSSTNGVVVSGNGQVTLTFSGPAGSDYRVWYTTNLTYPVVGHWTLLTNGVFPASPVVLVDNSATNSDRFYTVTQP